MNEVENGATNSKYSNTFAYDANGLGHIDLYFQEYKHWQSSDPQAKDNADDYANHVKSGLARVTFIPGYDEK